MHDARGTEPRARGGGIPDGALVGLLAFLLGLAVLVWSATGLAALFAKGAWPATVTFTRTPGAVRALIAQPHDIPGAWPDTAPAALSGWGLFWGLFISQLLVLLVLTIFTLGVVARTKARRSTRSRQRSKTTDETASTDRHPGPNTDTDDSPNATAGTHRQRGTGGNPDAPASTDRRRGTDYSPNATAGTHGHTTAGTHRAAVTGANPGPVPEGPRAPSDHPGSRTATEAERGRTPSTAAAPRTGTPPTPASGTQRNPAPGPPPGPAGARPDADQNGTRHASRSGNPYADRHGNPHVDRHVDPNEDPHTDWRGIPDGERHRDPHTDRNGNPHGNPHAPRSGTPDEEPAPAPVPAPPAPFPGPSQPAAAAPLPSSAAHAPVSAPAPRHGPAHPSDSPRTPAPAQEAYRYGFGYAPPARTAPAPAAHRLAYAAPAERHHLAARAVSAAEGSVLVVTSSPALWQDTKDARAKLGPVLLYDPSHLCDTPARMHWNPADGCADRDTAAARAVALLAPVRPQARLDAAVADTAETLLRSWLQAAALDGLPFKQLARWAQGNGSQEPVRILRTHPQAAPGAAGELESALIAHPERREQAQYLTARALSCLTSVHIREACNPNRTDALTLASFAAEGGTLYVVGESLEDPRTRPGAMPLLTALASHVVEHGRRMAVRSSHGRLDPPMTLVLEDVAAVAPVPQLPRLLTDRALPLLALCRSREQARTRWPDWPADIG
ncbi:hypothetical protein ACIRBY_21235 [Streptomyces sp. NPDC096136]|uniref:hypothetical protein n=1 Tax=Streptomyces sp. NPDC096136 TaxID=3366076 RepID=UPI00382C2E3E